MSKSRRALIILLGFLVLALGAWQYFKSQRSGQIVTGIATNPLAILVHDDNRTNVALLGIGGDGHAGGDLTDSMIIFSYSHLDQDLLLIPIPRDVWSPLLQAKINTAYHYGNQAGTGEGINLVKSSLTELTGLPLHYVVVLDFNAFVSMIDAVGGIDVEVTQTFDDYFYPIPGKETAEPESARYEHLHFDAGPRHLDGATALKYARSRHAAGDEGTDFARSKRQEQVILSFKDKLISTQTLTSVTTLQNLLASVHSSLDSDISDIEAGAFMRLFIDYSRFPHTSRTLDLTPLFTNPKNTAPYQGQWALIPATSLEDIHNYVADQL